MSTYDRPLVEQLLPAVWDSASAYGMQNPAMPDPDMPKAVADPAESNTLFAHLIDIKIGWTWAYIPLDERQTLLLRYAMDLTQAEIGRRLGVSQKTVSERLARGIGRIVAHLNGQPRA